VRALRGVVAESGAETGLTLDFATLAAFAPPPAPVRYVDFAERLGVTLTAPQRALARVAFDGEEPKDVPRAGEVFGPVQTIPASCRSVVVGVCGARSGKSYVFGALRLLWGALTRDLSSLAPGQEAMAPIVTPRLELGKEVLRYIVGAIQLDAALRSCLVGEPTQDRIRLRRPDGHRIEIVILPATRGGGALRGRALTDALLDECAFFRDETASVNDAELFRAVAPRVLPGGQVLLLSTPWLSSGLLYDMHRENFGHPVTAISALAPTSLMREGDATIAEMLGREKVRDPENYAREYDAQFMGAAAGAFFDPVAIERATAEYELGTLAAPGVMVTFGADFGFRRDSSALVGVHRTGPVSDPASRFRVAEMHERRPAEGLPLRPSETVAEFAGIVRKQRASYVVADGHYREAIAEHLATAGLGFVDAPTTPADAFVRARELLHEGRCVLPNEPRFLRQMRETVARPQSGGGLSIVLPRWKTGGHGDIVSAWVLAVHHAGGQTTVAAPSQDPDAWARRMEEEDDRRLAGEGQKPWWMKR